MKAIQVKYLPATNHRPSRLKAMAEGVQSITRSYHGDLASENPFREIAEELCRIYEWPTDLCEGGLPNGDHVFCFKS